MQRLAREQLCVLRPWFMPERPGPLIFSHHQATGFGQCRIDRWPDPRAVVVEVGGNYTIMGDPTAISTAALTTLKGFVTAPPEWEKILCEVDQNAVQWSRIISVLPRSVEGLELDPRIRRLNQSDKDAVANMAPADQWISETWDGPNGLCNSGMAWGLVEDGSVLTLAASFFVGEQFEDIGVVTKLANRRQGLAQAAAMAAAIDIRSRGRQPTWSTSPDNDGSLAIARHLGFVEHHHEYLWAVNRSIPSP